ncbi:micro-fibrillar-associated protein [Seminavis robusta]|uniref:Micro-fibrillar-associated protein n=1 Tax=Seminavis robusta TaxID=568900 RepID=A0A9N8HIQ8_9STRA|nr:micro-fibrillar-associated protein [Seminavis robusta]|eukprot:Sro637_g179430.1 micro-fibrillar-associated protein (612) ;mRNA; f:24953-26788
MASKKQGGAFGRDEMNLLLGVAGGDESTAGIGTAGTALLHGRGIAETHKKQSKGNKTQAVDFSTLSTAETAALIQQEQLSKGVAASTSRHRAQRSRSKKKLAHHELLEQELIAQKQQQAQQQQQQVQKHDAAGGDTEEEDETDFAAAANRKKTHNKRVQLEPQIVVAQKDAPRRQRQRRRRSSSSSSDSSADDNQRRKRQQKTRKDSSSDESDNNDNNRQRRNRRRRSSSSSSSSSEEDERRQRRLQKRRQLEAQNQKPVQKDTVKETSVALENRENEKPTRQSPLKQIEKANGKSSKAEDSAATATKKPKKKQQQESSSSSSASDGSSSDSDSSSSSSSSSEDEPAPVMAKPLFVPKRKRLQLEQEKLEAEQAQKEQEELDKKNKRKRKQESRAMVAEIVSTGTTKSSTNDDGMVSEDEEALAERMLNDKDDDEHQDKERDLWEVRELGRLLEEIDRLRKKEQLEAEYRRRQQLTDEQAQAEDMASGRYQQPGSNRMHAASDKDQPKFMQKYFHRGAYYMDEDEFEEGDVRLRAKEYEQGVTESAKSRGDIKNLPKVMQTKKFGRANQSKYQGLAKEDTSNRESSTVLPLVHHGKKHEKTTDVHRHRKNK